MKKIFLDKEAVGNWAAPRMNAVWCGQLASAIGLVEVLPGLPPRIIAGVIFSDWNYRSIQIHVAAEPGARWMTKAYLGACFQYAFCQVGVTKVLGFVGEGNHAARRFDEHLGFQLEATLKDSHPDGDLLIYSMTKDQCRWLNIQVPQEAFYGQE